MTPVTYESYRRWRFPFGAGLLTALFTTLTGDLWMGSHGNKAAVLLLRFPGKDLQIDDFPLGATQVSFETAAIFEDDLDVVRRAKRGASHRVKVPLL